MRRFLSILSAVALTGTLLIVLPTAASGASTLTRFKTKAVAVNATGYKMTLEIQGTFLTIQLKKRDVAARTLQQHSFSFNIADSTLSKNLGTGHVEGDLGNFGSLAMDFKSTGALSSKDSCGGEINTKKRTGTLTGSFEFKPDTQGNAFFETISFDSMKTNVTRTRYKNCQDHKLSKCPQQVVLYADALSGKKVPSGDVTVAVSVSEDAAPATFINHYLSGSTDDPGAMTYPDDLSTAELDASAIAPLASGMLSFTADGPPTFVQKGKCKGGKWSSEFASGSVTGMVDAHFDSFGDVTVSPTTGGMQRWVEL